MQDDYTQEVDDALADIDEICNESQPTAKIPPTENTDPESEASAAQDLDSMSIDEIEVELREKYSVRDFQYVYNTLKKDPDVGVETLLNIDDTAKAAAMKPILYRLRDLLNGDSYTVSETDSVAVQSMEEKTPATVIKSTLRNIPAEIQDLNQFTCRGGDDGKTPINPRNGYKARWKSNNEIFPFVECVESVEKGKYEGVSFLIRKENLILVIDLDHVAANGEIIDRKAQQIVHFFKGKAYIEFSKSKTGLHILVKYNGNLSQWIFTNGKMKSFNGDNDIKYEFFIDDHLISLTGNIFNNHSTLETIDMCELDQFLRQVFCDEYTRFVMLQFRSQGKLQLPTAGVEIDPSISFDVPPDELLEAAFQDPRYAEFAHVYQTGDSSIAGGRNQRDMRLILSLLTMTNGDLGAVEYLFKRSACYTNPNLGTKKDPDSCAGICRKQDPEYYLKHTFERAIDRWDGKYFVPKSIWLQYIAPNQEKQGKSRDKLDLSKFDGTEADSGQVIHQIFPDLIKAKQTESEKISYFNWQKSYFEPVSYDDLQHSFEEIGNMILAEASKLSRKDESEKYRRQALTAGGKGLKTKKFATAAMSFAPQECLSEDDLNASLEWLPLANCYINTNPFSDSFLQIIAPDKSMRFTMQCPVEYRPGAKCPIFMKVLKFAFPDPVERREFIKALAMGLIGGNPYQVMFFLYGLGTNGKSTLIKAFANAIGSDFSDDIKRGTLQFNPLKDSSASSSDLAKFKNKRALYLEEASKKITFDIAMLKNIIAGGKISARKLHHDESSFPCLATIYAMTNTFPGFSEEIDFAMDRRAIFFEFKKRVPPEMIDPNLDQKLASKEEKEGILALLIETGLVALYIDGGMKPTLAMKGIKKSMLAPDENPVENFFDECIDLNAEQTSIISSKALVSLYKHYIALTQGKSEADIKFEKDSAIFKQIENYLYKIQPTTCENKVRNGNITLFKGICVLDSKTVSDSKRKSILEKLENLSTAIRNAEIRKKNEEMKKYRQRKQSHELQDLFSKTE